MSEKDLAGIEARLKAALQEKESYSGIGSGSLNDWPIIIDEDYDFVTAPLAQELFDHAPTDIAALLQEVKRLREELNHSLRVVILPKDDSDFYIPESEEE